MLITQSSWLLTLSPNCQITIPKSFKPTPSPFGEGTSPPICSPLLREHKGTKFFALSSPPSILHPTSRQGGQRYEVFDIHKYHPTPPPPCHLSKIMPNLTTSLTPLSSAPPPASPFSGSAKVRSCSLCQVLSPHTPSLLPSLRGATKLRTFWHLQASLLSKTHSPLRGERKGTKFFALSSPPSIPPRFFLGSAKVQRF